MLDKLKISKLKLLSILSNFEAICLALDDRLLRFSTMTEEERFGSFKS